MLIKMYVLLHLLLSKLHPVSRLVVILPIHITDVNNLGLPPHFFCQLSGTRSLLGRPRRSGRVPRRGFIGQYLLS